MGQSITSPDNYKELGTRIGRAKATIYLAATDGFVEARTIMPPPPPKSKTRRKPPDVFEFVK